MLQKQHQEEGGGGLEGAREVGLEERAEGAERAWGSQKKKSERDAACQRAQEGKEEEEEEEEDSFFDAEKKRVECHALADAREQLLAESERCLAEIGHSY